MAKSQTQKMQRFTELWYIFRRNVLLLTNAVIFVVCVMLVIFGDIEEGVFLGIVLIFNMALGLAQDIRAWIALERLQLLTAPSIMLIKPDGSEHSIPVENIQKGDRLKLKIGDQVPCDGELIEVENLELNQGLITGESDVYLCKKGQHVLAGSIVTSGKGVLCANAIYAESRIARMTEGVKSYSVSASPIQRAVGKVVVWSGYLLIAVIGFIVIRGMLVGDSSTHIVKNVGALASIIVPQGLVFAITLLFAYGAAHLFQKNVLLQEVNATEKLGRIKNLCMDKTGTLTENTNLVESLQVPLGISEEKAKDLTKTYIVGSGDSSQTIRAIDTYLGERNVEKCLATMPFSSWRQYGAVQIRESNEDLVLMAGAPEYFIAHLRNKEERDFLEKFLQGQAHAGKRIFSLVCMHTAQIPERISENSIELLAVYVLASPLRPGIVEAVKFFQDRGVRIRILSGDNVETVRAVASAAGVIGCDAAVSGAQLHGWTDEDYRNHSREYTIFARIVPEQKEKIIEAMKLDGFTAMVGDGANDALAIKRADLGIAMFEGAPATRQLASVVLMNNSFTALPGGVMLAESIIDNAEIFGSIFFSQALVGTILFAVVSMFGHTFPLSPLNITLINYFTVGIPGILVSYWTIRPKIKTQVSASKPFLRRILPFVVVSSVLQSIAISFVFFISPSTIFEQETNILVVIAFMILGYLFFVFTPGVFRGAVLMIERVQLLALGVIETAILFFGLKVSFLTKFFDVHPAEVSTAVMAKFALVVIIYIFLQYIAARWSRRYVRALA